MVWHVVHALLMLGPAVFPCPYPTPYATSSPPTGVSATGATLQGTVNDNGGATTVSFEYGLTTCYGSSTPGTPGTISAGTGPTAVSAPISGLVCNTRYHFRTRAVSGSGTATGSDVTFTTAPCP
jgi:hypothetical protein